MRIGATEEACLASSSSAFHSYSTEHRARFDCGEIDIRRYVWDHPTTDSWTSCAYFIDMSMTPRPKPNWAVFKDEARAKRLPLDRIWFVPPGRTVESGAGVGWQRSLHLSIDDSAFGGFFAAMPDWRDFVSGDTLRLCGSTVDWLLTEMARELQQPGFASTLVMDSLARATAAAIVRACRLESPGQPDFVTGGLAPWRLRRIRERAFADLPAPSLDELARLCDLSVRHLSRAFRAETGQTIAGFVQQATAERALAMLADPALPIADIARSLGFSSGTTFAYAFRRATGARPSEVRAGRKACARMVQ